MELLQLALWFLYLAIALFILVRGSGMFLKGAQHLGKSFGISGFAIGVMIVAFGTSLPELASSIAAALQGSTEIVIANVVGSNITNILLIVGLLAVIGGRIAVTHELIKTELPIFFIATAHFVVILFDGQVDRLEAMLLLGTFTAYVWYLFSEGRKEKKIIHKKKSIQIDFKSLLLAAVGVTGVLVGAHYTVVMSVNIATALLVPVGLVTIGAIALGTSLPELFVSIHALRKGEIELAMGNIFGSNAFNILVVIGIPALISSPLIAEPIIMQVGLPVLVASSAIFFVTGLSRQVMRWEGVMMLLFFVFFVVKLASFI